MASYTSHPGFIDSVLYYARHLLIYRRYLMQGILRRVHRFSRLRYCQRRCLTSKGYAISKEMWLRIMN